MSEGFTTRLLTGPEMTSWADDVRALAAQAQAPNPHALFVAATGQDSKNGEATALACFAPGGALTGFWPVRRKRLLPGVNVLGAPLVPLYDIAGYPLLAPGQERPVFAALVRHALTLQRAVSLRVTLAEGPVWDALTDMAEAGDICLTVLTRWERALLERSAAPDAQSYLNTAISSSTRKRLRAKRRSLEENGPIELVMHQTPEATLEGFAAYLQLEAAGWKGQNATALAQNPSDAAYVRGTLMQLAPEGAMIAELRQDKRVLASGLLIRAGGEVFFWKTAYNETLARQSPGVLLDLLLTEWLYDQPWFTRLDTATDDSIDPNGLIWSERRAMAHVLIEPPGGAWQGRVAAGAYRLRQRLKMWRNKTWRHQAK
jgi:CelD/BcsL family acetyltransferase involved in cellulose biosynthesis